MPEIESRILGKVEVSDNNLYHLNGSILAFEDYDEFYLLNMDEEGTFKILQSKDDKNICFILIDPFLVFKDYKPVVKECTLECCTAARFKIFNTSFYKCFYSWHKVFG
jgi:flagellar assembly factor FliW